MVATLNTTVIQNASSSTANITLDTAGNVTGGANLVATGMPYGSSSFLRNRIINGNMVIDQRNAGAAISAANLTNNSYTIDRWQYISTQTAKFNAQQNQGSVTTPVGFPNYFGLTSQSAYSVLTGDFFGIRQQIEGFNAADLAWGTASAKTVTLSFLVYSSLTGTFGGSIYNGAGTRSYPFSYSVASANTWTTISVTIPGDTSGTWIGNTNASWANISFGLGAGATYSGTVNTWASALYTQPTSTVSVVGTSGATFYITSVQLEQGSVATPFERPLYSKQLADCQRYFQYFDFIAIYGQATNAGTLVRQYITFPVQLRANPTLTYSSITLNGNSGFTTYNARVNGFNPSFTSTAGNGNEVDINGLNVSAEL